MPLGRICSHRAGAICTECPHGRCRLDDRRRHLKSQAHGLNTRDWEIRREAALTRAGHRCQLQLPGCTGAATTVHLRPELAGDHLQATLDDLTACCAHCHGVVDAPRARPA